MFSAGTSTYSAAAEAAVYVVTVWKYSQIVLRHVK